MIVSDAEVEDDNTIESILLEARLNDHATDYHLPKNSMQRLKVEDQVQLAHIFEQSV